MTGRSSDSIMRIILILIAFLASQVVARDIDFCYAEEDDPYLYMGTKTAYHFIHGGKTRYQAIPDCEPLQIWILSRHGTRYPGKSDITKLLTLSKLRDQIVYNHETRGYGHLCNADLRNLKNWRLDANVTLDVASYLTKQGEEDMKLLARRLQSNFPELLQPNAANITSTNYKFRTTDTQRGRASMQAFMAGLFGSTTAVTPEDTPTNDTLLLAYKSCPAWESMSGNDSANEETNKFQNGEEFRYLLRNVSRRLGFLYNITTASVILMYDMCRYEKAWTVSELSPWCAVFSKEDLRVLEYNEDLLYYYYSGYGHEMNSRIGCSPLQDMFDHFQKLERRNYSGQPKGIFYFSHSTTLQTFMSAMGIAKDSTPLTASNYNAMSKRQWRTSEIGSFATNLVAVFYKCNSTNEPNKVMFYLEEKPLLFEGCEVGLCDWEYLKNKLGGVAFNCNLDFCWSENGSSSLVNSSPRILLFLLFFLVLFRH